MIQEIQWRVNCVRMDIPLQYRLKLGVYDIQLNGVQIKARLVNQNDLLEIGISELRSRMGDLPLAGVDFKISNENWMDGLLLIYVKDRCLIIQLRHIMPFAESLGYFLSDKSICFVGFKIESHFNELRYGLHENCLTGKGAEICTLAALVLKNPSLQKCGGLVELASKIGFDMKAADRKTAPAEWGALVFSEEEIKYAIHDAHHCYHIGKKLLGMLD